MINKESLILMRNDKIQDYYEFNNSTKIGSGAFGLVMKGRLKGTKQTRAIKRIPKSKMKDPSQLANEITIMQKLDHPNIVRLFETFEDDKFVYMVMEMCTGGQLFDRIMQKGSFSELEAREVMYEVMQALRYCHGLGVVHRDLKPENMLLRTRSDDSPVKLIDFGLSKLYSADALTQGNIVGTSYYIAPQVLDKKYSSKCDIWSMGVILYILLTGVPPFNAENDQDIIAKVKKGSWSVEPLQEAGVSPDAIDLIQKMLVKEVDRRLRAEEVLEHPWFKGLILQVAKPLNLDNFKSFMGFNMIKKVAVSVLASQLSGEQIEQLSKAFKALDVNGDGFLTTEEVIKCISQTKTVTDIEGMMKAIDMDENGKVSYNEFIAASLEMNTYLLEENLRLMFKVFDVDNNGKITKEEMQRILDSSSSDKRIKDLINEADTDGDGCINYNQFLTLMNK